MAKDKSQDNLFFSVVTICRNAENDIEKTLRSVIGQECADIEYLVIDGNSTDGTLSILRQYEDSIDILVSEPDRGIYNAMNKGLRLAHGRYVIFMNAGDVFASMETLVNVKSAINGFGGDIPLFYGDYIRTDGSDITQVIPARPASKAWYGMFASHQSMFYNLPYLRTQKLEYDESYKIAADYKLTLEVVHRAGIEKIIHLPLCISRFDICGISVNNQNEGLREADRARKEVCGMSAIVRFGIVVLQRCARVLRENKVFSSIYGLLRY